MSVLVSDGATLSPLGALARSLRALPVSTKLGVAALAFVVLFVVTFYLLPVHDPFGQSLRDRLLPFWSAGSSGKFYILGTDQMGRDLLSRLAYAGAITLSVAVGAVAVSAVVGTAIGLVAGLFGGFTDRILTAVGDVQLSIPRVLVVVAAVAAVGPSLLNLVLILGLTSWVPYARIVRATTLTLREREFIQASRVLGAGNMWIVWRHLLPNVVGRSVIVGSFEIGEMVVIEASLSYLGLGVQAPLPSWGSMINDAQTYLYSAPQLVLLPGLLLFLFIAGSNIVSQLLTSEAND